MSKILYDVTNNVYLSYNDNSSILQATENSQLVLQKMTIKTTNNELILLCNDFGNIGYGYYNGIPNSELTYSNTPYVFKIVNNKNNTFIIQDSDNKYSLYFKDYIYYMGNSTNISYFQMIDLPNENSIWLFTKNPFYHVKSNRCLTKCTWPNNIWDCEANSTLTTANCQKYNSMECDSDELRLGGECECSKGSGHGLGCAKPVSGIKAEDSCPKFNNLVASNVRYNVANGNVYKPNPLPYHNDNINLICKYNYNDMVNTLNQNTLENLDQVFGTDNTDSPVYPGYKPLNEAKEMITKEWCKKIVGPNYNSPDPFYKNNTFLRLSDTRICKPWCNNNTDECNKIKKEYCQGENLHDPLCKDYCKTNNCDTVLKNYCENKDINDEKYTDLCGCFKSKDFYNSYLGDLKAKFPSFPEEYFIPTCSFPMCASSTLQPTEYKNKKCPDIVRCIQNITIKNTGNIGDIKIKNTGECTKIFNSCQKNQILKLGTCEYCPENTVPNSDMTECIVLECDDNQVLKNGNCVTCENGQIPSLDKTKCIDKPIPISDKYSCNFITNTCELNVDGNYNKLGDCQETCGIYFSGFIFGIVITFIILIIIGIIILRKK